jgi:small subunit ribosomal protein S1
MDQKQSDRQMFSSLLESEEYSHKSVRRGEVRKATILATSENDLVVDLGVKRDGIVPPRDLALLEDEYRTSLLVGELVPVVVLTTRGRNGELVVSLNQGLLRQDWLEVEALLESGDACGAKVTEENRGGVVVSYGQLRGFVPQSHLASIPRGMRVEHLRRAKADLIGRTLSLVVTEVDQRRQRLIFSERAANHRCRQRMLEELAEGEVRTGTVSRLVNFGAFVDLGEGVEGLAHVSKMPHGEGTLTDLELGSPVVVRVLGIDQARRRIALDLRHPVPAA